MRSALRACPCRQPKRSSPVSNHECCVPLPRNRLLLALPSAISSGSCPARTHRLPARTDSDRRRQSPRLCVFSRYRRRLAVRFTPTAGSSRWRRSAERVARAFKRIPAPGIPPIRSGANSGSRGPDVAHGIRSSNGLRCRPFPSSDYRLRSSLSSRQVMVSAASMARTVSRNGLPVGCS